VKLALVFALVACSHDAPPRAPIANTSTKPPVDAAPALEPCSMYFDVAKRAIACTSLDQRTRDAIQHDIDDMTAEVAERGMDGGDPGLVDERCFDLADRITKLAEGPCGWR
jgi:hypothetical protein